MEGRAPRVELVRGLGQHCSLILLSAAGGVLLAAVTASLSPALVVQSASLLGSEAFAQVQAPAPARMPPRQRTGRTEGLPDLILESHKFGVYSARPEGAGTLPGVVLVHDSWGLNADFKKMADRLARGGFFVMAPDLYAGKVALDADKAREMATLLDKPAAVGLLDELSGYLKTHPGVGDHRVGVVGFGMGGHVALLTGMKSRDLSAVVVAYGSPVLEAEALRSIPCPILALYGDDDEITIPQHIEAFRSALAAARRTADVKTYPSTGYGFMDEADSRYKAGPAQEAWDRVSAFLKSNL